MPRNAPKWLALALGIACALPLVLLGRGCESSRGELGVEVVGDLETLGELLRERAAAGGPPPDPSTLDPSTRPPVPAADADVLFPVLVTTGAAIEPNAHTYFRFRGGLERVVPVSYHPNRRFVFRTNSLGMREDGEPREPPPALRVLVAGDSHTEGYCDNADSWPNQLERELSERGLDAEVLNAGMSGYSFYQYLGTLEQFEHLAPDVFVMAVYGGNDFTECLPLEHWFRRTEPGPCADCDMKAWSQRAPELASAIFHQAFHQLHLLRRRPRDVELALGVATNVTRAVATRCAELGIRLLVLYLPPMPDCQPELYAAEVERCARLYGMTAKERQATERLAERWIERARAAGVEVADMRDVLCNAGEPVYWARDYHLSLRGNALVAAAVDELLGR